MHIQTINIQDTNKLKKIIEIHDLIPSEWLHEYQPHPNGGAKLLQRIQDSEDIHGFWISENKSEIKATLWAKIVLNDRSCSVQSLWVDKSLRHKGHSKELTLKLLPWAKEHGVTKFTCCTHSNNSRMREILTSLGFNEGMIAYEKTI